MFKVVKGVLRSLIERYQIRSDPNGFVRSLGVHLGSRVRFFGVNRGMFGSEPWMISIGNGCYITADVQFVTHDGGTLILRQEKPDLEWTAPIEIGNDVYIGIRTIVLPGVRVGNRCVIGAGSVVTKDIPDNCVAAGVPARVICSTDQYLTKLERKSLRCGHLQGEEKASAIKAYYEERGWPKKES